MLRILKPNVVQPRFSFVRLINYNFNTYMQLYKFFAFLIITVSCFLAVSAQDDDEIKVDTSIVRLNVGAVSRSGQPVKNLTKENFSIYEDGVKQEIIRFEPTTSPFSVVMILDMSGSTLGFRQTIQQSAFRFVDALAPTDRIAVIEFYDKVNLLKRFYRKPENRRTFDQRRQWARQNQTLQCNKSRPAKIKRRRQSPQSRHRFNRRC